MPRCSTQGPCAAVGRGGYRPRSNCTWAKYNVGALLSADARATHRGSYSPAFNALTMLLPNPLA
jgi:hypothetical protein